MFIMENPVSGAENPPNMDNPVNPAENSVATEENSIDSVASPVIPAVNPINRVEQV